MLLPLTRPSLRSGDLSHGGERGGARRALLRRDESAAIRLLYAESLPLWRVCPRGYCRRHRCCNGEATACLKRGWPQMPGELQTQAYESVLVGGPRHLLPATQMEWRLRRFPPTNFVL